MIYKEIKPLTKQEINKYKKQSKWLIEQCKLFSRPKKYKNIVEIEELILAMKLYKQKRG